MPSALTIRKIDGKPGTVYYPLEITNIPSPTPSQNDLTIAIHAFSLDHRDLFIRQHLYPGTTFNVPLSANGVGVVSSTGSSSTAKTFQGKRVILNPAHGWEDDPDGPENPKGLAILGGTKIIPLGCATTSLVVTADEVALAPEHLSDVEAAALPLVGLTAWRATMVKAASAMRAGRNVLVTGIGGGVAIMALLFMVAKGVNVYVTSGDEAKIERAVSMGAKGGVSYKEANWEKRLLTMLPPSHPVFDAIIDGSGGDIVDKAVKLLKHGGVISIYGMTIAPKMNWSMAAVLKNIEVRGSTMGSKKDFKDMLSFVSEKGIRPVVSKVAMGLRDLEAIDALFEDMKAAKQFGKLVVEITEEERKMDESGDAGGGDSKL